MYIYICNHNNDNNIDIYIYIYMYIYRERDALQDGPGRRSRTGDLSFAEHPYSLFVRLDDDAESELAF